MDDAAGATNPGFTAGTCPTSSTGEEYGWAFVAPGAGMVIESLRVEFASAGAVMFFVPGSTRAQAYVFTPGPDEIVARHRDGHRPEPRPGVGDPRVRVLARR